MDIDYSCILTLLIIVETRSQSKSLHGLGVAIQGESYIFECNTNEGGVFWFEDNAHIATTYKSYPFDGCIYTNIKEFYRNIYENEKCIVKHKLSIKSVDYYRDNGKKFWCHYNYYESSNSITLSVAYPVAISNQSILAVEGSPFVLRCQSFSSHVKWYRNEEELIFSYNTTSITDRCYHGYTELYQFKNCGNNHELTITTVNYKRDNNTRFECRAGAYTSNDYTLNVNVLPKFAISKSPIHGENFDLICYSTYSLLWTRQTHDGHQSYIGTSSAISRHGCSVQSDYNSSYEFPSCGSVKQTLTIKSVDFYQDNSSSWFCYAPNYNDTYTLDVTVPVSYIEIKYADLKNSTIRVEESQQISIQCVTSFAYPEPSVILRVCNNVKCDNYTTTKFSENQTTITYQITLNSTVKFDNTEIYCSAVAKSTNTQSIFSRLVKLFILHHPRLRVEEKEGELLCIAEARPRNVTFLPWKHTIHNKLVREIDGYYINTTVYSLNITNSQNDGGNYTCTANNGISDPNTKQLDQIAYYNLDLNVQPTLYNVEGNNNFVMGQNGSFSLKYVEIKATNASWYSNGTDLQTNDRITIREEPTEISHPYNNSIKLSGIKTILTLKLITTTDVGTYTCLVCNLYGCSHKIFEMDVVLMRKEISENDGITDVTTTVIGASVGATVILICVLVIMFIIVFKRRRSEPGGQSERKRGVRSGRTKNAVENLGYFDTGKPQLTDKAPVEMEIIENDLYISSDALDADANTKVSEPENVVVQTKKVEMEIIENDLYISSDALDADANTKVSEPENVVVQTKKVEMEIIENDLYISSDSLDDGNTKQSLLDIGIEKDSQNDTTKADCLPKDDIAKTEKAGVDSKTTSNDVIEYYNTISDVVSYKSNNTETPYINSNDPYVNDPETPYPITDDPYVNSAYINRQQLEKNNL